MIEEKIAGEVAYLAAAGLIAIGAYGLTATNNMFRMLLSLEVIFNGVLLAVVAFLSFNPVYATAIGVILVSVVSAEIIVVVAIIAGLFRYTRSFDTRSLEEEGV